MQSRRHRQELTRRVRRDRRRLGRFVAFAELEANLSPITLFDQPSPSGAGGGSEAPLSAPAEALTRADGDLG
jgi:hypothetical protein